MKQAGEFGMAKLPGAEINRWTLRFRSPEVEREFDRQWLDQSLKLIRIWSVIGIGGFIAFGLAEWWIYPAKIGVSFALRYGLVLPIQLGFYAVTYTRWHRRTHAFNLVFCTFLTNAAYLYLVASSPFPQGMIYYFMILLITLFTHGFVGVRFVHSFLASYLTFACYAVIVLAINPLTPKTSAVLLLVLFLATTIAVFSTYNQEIHVRRDFRLNKLLAVQKRESEELARQAMAASEAKSRFLAMMSHELRTPLNAIIGFAEVISNQMFGPVQPERYREYAGDIGQSGKHLLALINDILDLSKASDSQTRLRDESVRIADVVAFSLRLAKARAEEARLTIDVAIPADLPNLRADERMLRQIVLNLLSNAVKFTPSGGRVSIVARRDAPGDVLLSVADTGIGIAPQDMAVAMAPFGQVDNTLARKYEGTGLGLPLARSLVELHGGTLTLTSRVGAGTTATVRFPAARTEPAARPPEAAAAD